MGLIGAGLYLAGRRRCGASPASRRSGATSSGSRPARIGRSRLPHPAGAAAPPVPQRRLPSLKSSRGTPSWQSSSVSQRSHSPPLGAGHQRHEGEQDREQQSGSAHGRPSSEMGRKGPRRRYDTLTRSGHRRVFAREMTATEDLKSTLNLPRTDFPMKANLAQAEPKRLESWESAALYAAVRAARARAPRSSSSTTGLPTPTATSTSAPSSTRS